MRSNFCVRLGSVSLVAVAFAVYILSPLSIALGKDFIVVIGGGFSRESNQASLEANLIFVQSILEARGQAENRRFFYFADGNDEYADLQIVAPKPPGEHELIRLLRGIHRQDSMELAYRNHNVPFVNGKSSPENVKACLTEIAAQAAPGDRVIVYVTAHGGSGARRSPRNTTVMGWDRSSFSVSDFAEWLRMIPEEVPCISIMAQCYCGGFADAIFEKGDEKRGLSKRLQVGFFAQQHNLPAAGCRPDIENDEEFSSYFWGAMVGQSRTGESFSEVDFDTDGIVSFAEAYAFTVIASRTIDIPLRASDRLLRVYSRFDLQPDEQSESDFLSDSEDKVNIRASNREGVKSEQAMEGEAGREVASTPRDKPSVKESSVLRGPISELLQDSNPTTHRIVMALIEQLGVPEGADASEVYRMRDEFESASRPSGNRTRFRSRSGRRQLLSMIGARWERLADRDQWESHVAQLPSDERDSILRDIQSLEGFSDYQRNREETQARIEKAQARELQQVAFTRLINHLELAVLERNLSRCASVEIQERYHAMVQLENQGL